MILRLVVVAINEELKKKEACRIWFTLLFKSSDFKWFTTSAIQS